MGGDDGAADVAEVDVGVDGDVDITGTKIVFNRLYTLHIILDIILVYCCF